MAFGWKQIADITGPQGIPGNALSPEALQAAVDAAAAYVTAQALVSAELTSQDRMEIGTDERTVVSISDTEGQPFFTNAPAPAVDRIPRDSLEWWDGDVFLAAIDDLTGIPHIRNGGSGGGGGFTETHFIILVGQSNSMGIGKPSPIGTNDPLPNLYYVPQRGTGAGIEVQATEPLRHPYDDPYVESVGHGWTVARDYALEHPGVRVVILPMAMSGSGFFYSSSPTYTWAPSRVGEAGTQNLYSLALSKCNTAISSYTGTKRVAMFIWHQGEADAVGNTTQAQYEGELDLLIAGLRTNLIGGVGVDAPFIIGQLGWEFRNVRMPGTYAQIDAAHQSTPARVKRTAFAPAPPAGFMNADNTHFTARGQKQLATSILAALPDAYYNL